MTNIASVLKSEIARVARKEVRAEIEGLKKASTQHRAAIAQLRRQISDLERALKQTQRAAGGGARATRKASEEGAADDALGGTPRRFSASRLEAHRKRLGLSAADYGMLVGVTGSTIYNWEQGKARPPRAMVQKLGFVKQQTPTAIRARVAELSTAPGAVSSGASSDA